MQSRLIDQIIEMLRRKAEHVRAMRELDAGAKRLAADLASGNYQSNCGRFVLLIEEDELEVIELTIAKEPPQ